VSVDYGRTTEPFERTTLRAKGQLTLPKDVRDALHVDAGDQIEFEVVEPGVVLVRGLKLIRADQAWFWTESWQRGEAAASADIEQGRVETFRDGDSFLDSFE
jgi:antitoxin PrlF